MSLRALVWSYKKFCTGHKYNSSTFNFTFYQSGQLNHRCFAFTIGKLRERRMKNILDCLSTTPSCLVLIAWQTWLCPLQAITSTFNLKHQLKRIRSLHTGNDGDRGWERKCFTKVESEAKARKRVDNFRTKVNILVGAAADSISRFFTYESSNWL